MRINPEYKKQLEELFAKCGMTLSEATNVFFQMALTTGGLPFNVNSDPKIVLGDRSVAYLEGEFKKRSRIRREGRLDLRGCHAHQVQVKRND
jgi:addiction module RelB/DinJ family antitoxin